MGSKTRQRAYWGSLFPPHGDVPLKMGGRRGGRGNMGFSSTFYPHFSNIAFAGQIS
jgi:hypothetical protein